MAETPTQSRFSALDGLRGIAALIVLVHHVELVSPQLGALTSAGPDISGAPLFWLATYTPFHALWAGTESVFLFFVLSGFVLTLPFLRMNRPSWLSYYPKRMVRLYIPVWASVALALLLAFLVPRVADPRFSAWINPHSGPVSVLNNASLLGTDDLNSPLWSLTWEVLFSLLLPAYLVLALKFRRFWILGACGLLVAIGIADMVHNIALLYLPMFGIGVLMAVQKDLLAAWCSNLGRWGWALLFTIAMVLFTARWTFTGMIGSVALSTLGSALIILAFLCCRPAVRLGSTRYVQWAGDRKSVV